MRLTVLLALVLLGIVPTASQDPIAGRWVGTHNNRPLHLDFFGDTMVVVNDQYPASYYLTYDSLVVMGDTSFAVGYWFSLNRLLLRTGEGRVVTMSKQDALARPIYGVWSGSPIGQSTRTVVLQMQRGGVARRRTLPGGSWTEGEWNRRSRDIEFTWRPDSTQWVARYDAAGLALLFEHTDEETGTLILRKVWR